MAEDAWLNGAMRRQPDLLALTLGVTGLALVAVPTASYEAAGIGGSELDVLRWIGFFLLCLAPLRITARSYAVRGRTGWPVAGLAFGAWYLVTGEQVVLLGFLACTVAALLAIGTGVADASSLQARRRIEERLTGAGEVWVAGPDSVDR